MKTTLKYGAALLPLLFGVLVHAADSSAPAGSMPTMPVVTVQTVTTDDPSGYATWVAMANDKFKAAGGPEHFTHVYEGRVAGDSTGVVFAVRVAESAVAMAKAQEAMMKSPDRAELAAHLASIRKLGPAIMMKALRYEGGYPGEWDLVTDVQVKDEAAYIKAIGDLRPLLDSHDLKDIRVNLYRVTVGRSTYSHKVVISAPSQERSAAMLDAQSESWMSDWLASLASLRTVVHNGIYQEISK